MSCDPCSGPCLVAQAIVVLQMKKIGFMESLSGIGHLNLYDFLNHRYEHPLLIEGREKTEWVLPITVHAPPPRGAPASGTRSEKLFSLDPMWVHN